MGETPDDLDINVDDLDTPDEGDYLDYTDHEMDWEGGLFRMGGGKNQTRIKQRQFWFDG